MEIPWTQGARTCGKGDTRNRVVSPWSWLTVIYLMESTLGQDLMKNSDLFLKERPPDGVRPRASRPPAIPTSYPRAGASTPRPAAARIRREAAGLGSGASTEVQSTTPRPHRQTSKLFARGLTSVGT